MNTFTTTVPGAVDVPLTPDRPAIEARRRARRLPWGRILPAAAIAAAIGAGTVGYLRHAAAFETTDDAFLEGNVHPVSARINGTVARVLIDDNAHVEAGQPLVELDPADLNLAVEAAEADLAQARANELQVAAQVARARAEVETAAARVVQNAAELNRAELDFHRMEMLMRDDGAISRQQFDAAKATFDAARATQQSMLSQRASADAALAAAQAQRGVVQAQTQKSEAALRIAKLQADYTIIRAPNSGRIAKKNVEVGQRVQPGQPVMSVVNDRTWVVANFKESQLARLRPGEKVEIRIDAIAGDVFHGVVDSFSPGTGARFSLLPPDNATGNFNKIVQRVPVKIRFSDETAASMTSLAPGLSAVVRVNVRH